MYINAAFCFMIITLSQKLLQCRGHPALRYAY